MFFTRPAMVICPGVSTQGEGLQDGLALLSTTIVYRYHVY